MNDLMTYYSNFNKVSYYNNPSNNQYDNCNYFQNDNYSDKTIIILIIIIKTIMIKII